MRIFILEDKKIESELEKEDKFAKVQKIGETYKILSNDFKIIISNKNIKEILEIAADLGILFLALENLDEEIKKIEEDLGFNIPRITKMDEIQNTPNFESLKSLIQKIKQTDESKECGAIGVFIGFVREISHGKLVKQLEYEAYTEMLDKKIGELINGARTMGAVNAEIYHRIGTLKVGEDIVYIVVMGKGRKDIWEPLRILTDNIKTKLPIWKKEVYYNGQEMWVHDMK